MRPAMRPFLVAWTSVAPMRKRASSTVAMGRARRVSRDMRALSHGGERRIGMLCPEREDVNRNLLAAMSCWCTRRCMESTHWRRPPAPRAKPASKAPEPPKIPYPEWLFPIDADALRLRRTRRRRRRSSTKWSCSIPDSDQKYTLARINDQFNAPDWHPEAHIPMPEIVAKGRKPKIMACAFCHTPTGQGRPENSALAGPARGLYKGAAARLSQRRAPAHRPGGLPALPRHARDRGRA